MNYNGQYIWLRPNRYLYLRDDNYPTIIHDPPDYLALINPDEPNINNLRYEVQPNIVRSPNTIWLPTNYVGRYSWFEGFEYSDHCLDGVGFENILKNVKTCSWNFGDTLCTPGSIPPTVSLRFTGILKTALTPYG